MANASYQPKVYRRQGGDHLVAASGGQIILEAGAVLSEAQPTPATVTAAATLTAAQLLGRLITGTQSTGSTNALTLPTGTLMSAALVGDNDQSFEFTIINLSAAVADTYTLTAGTDFSIVGDAIIPSAHVDAESTGSAVYRCRQSTATVWIAYRIS